MKNYIYLFLFGLLMFGLTFFVALNFFDETKEEQVSEQLEKARAFREISENNIVEETSFEEEKIGVNANFIIEEKYLKCNHTVEVVSSVDNEMVNLTEKEFEKEYPNYNIKEFSKDEVKVEEEIMGICNEHFKISLGDDFIEVFKLNSDEEEELYMVTNISRDYLASSDIEKLSKGIDVYGKGNINSKLEDYE